MKRDADQQTLLGPSGKAYWTVWWCYRQVSCGPIFRASRKFLDSEYTQVQVKDFARARMSNPKVLSGGIMFTAPQRVFDINQILAGTEYAA